MTTAINATQPTDPTPGEADLDERVRALTAQVEQWHRDGALMVAYNADRTELTSHLPLALLPEAAVAMARAQYPGDVASDTFTGVTRLGAAIRAEGLLTDEAIAPGGLLARMLAERLAVDLLALGC